MKDNPLAQKLPQPNIYHASLEFSDAPGCSSLYKPMPYTIAVVKGEI